jgi:hypothetical protein
MKYLLTGIVCFLLTGCAAQFTTTKADMTDFRRDNFDCSQQSRTMMVGPLIAWPIMQAASQKQSDRTYQECMEIRGYTVTAQ